MPRKNRETLRNFFDDGRLPTKDNFADMIDSMLNMSDEGFSKSPENGVEVSTPTGKNTLFSFYRDRDPKTPVWSMGYGGERDLLYFVDRRAKTNGAATRAVPVMSFDRDNRVGINTTEPGHTLDVAGVLSTHGRIGSLPPPAGRPLPLADGAWYDISEELSGCQAFEVMAGAGHPGEGRYALMHAVAMNAYNPRPGLFDVVTGKRRIRCDNSWYGKRCDKLVLRWLGTHGKDAKYRLQIRSRCSYGEAVPIKVYLTALWFDPLMKTLP